MKFSKTLFVSCLILIAAIAFIPSASAFTDAGLTLTQTVPTADATNATSSIDLGATTPDVVWKQAYIKASIPALPNATNAATTLLFTLQTSANNSSWASTSPLVQGQIVGGSSATSNATVIRFPIPHDVSRYIRVQQIVPAAAGTNTTVTNTYTLVVP